jgi:hypothetical protein
LGVEQISRVLVDSSTAVPAMLRDTLKLIDEIRLLEARIAQLERELTAAAKVTFRPFFVLTGIGTAGAFAYAFWPEWAMAHIAKLAYREEHTILVQHWGIMVGLMGVFMVVAAFRANWRNPILIYSGLEKSFMVYLILSNVSRPYSQGFWFGGVMGCGRRALHDRLFRGMRI